VFPREKFLHLINCVGSKKSKILSFTHYSDALRSLAADILIRNIIIDKFKLNNSDIHFQYNKYGKPSLSRVEGFHFNISHSGIWVVCAISNKSIGIDIEKIESMEELIVKRFFSQQEKEDLYFLADSQRRDYFYDLWTLKESYIKAKGKGLSIALNSFTIRKCEEGNFVLKRDEGLLFKQFTLFPNYKMSVCVEKGTYFDKVKIHNLDILYKAFSERILNNQ